MGIQIGGLTRNADGTITLTGVTFPTKACAMRALDDLLAINADAYAPREPTAPAYSHSEAVYRAKVHAAGRATGRSIGYGPTDFFGEKLRVPRANLPPFVDFAENPIPALDDDEPPLRAFAYTSSTGETFTEDEAKAGGSD